MPIDSQNPKTYIRQVSSHLTENKNDLIKLIKTKWLPQPGFRSHMKTDNANRLADPEKKNSKENSEKNCVEKKLVAR